MILNLEELEHRDTPSITLFDLGRIAIPGGAMDDATTWITVGGATVGGGLLGAFLKDLIAAARSFWKQGYDQGREAKRDAQTELGLLLDRVKKDADDSRRIYQADMAQAQRRIDAVIAELRLIERKYAKALGWIEYHSPLLQASPHFRPWTEPNGDDSGEHRPLQEDKTGGGGQ